MVDRLAVYRTWAPETARWSPWAKPVLFSALTDEADETGDMTTDISWLPPPVDGVVLVLDLPGADSVWLGLSLAIEGYRPVPLYNALPAPYVGGGAVVDLRPIMRALVSGTRLLANLALPDDAPPAFLLHAERRLGAGRAGLFDNRAVCFTTDFPSANLLRSQGCGRVLLVEAQARAPQPDLCHTLARWEDGGLPVWRKILADGEPPSLLKVPRPSAYRRIAYRVLEALGLYRNELGGFGGYPPELHAGG